MASSTAQVTVAVPTLARRPEMLASSLRSLAAQGDLIDVVVVVDDGVDERGEDVARSLAESNGATVIRRSGRGLSAAINEVFRGATTEFVAWLGDDDLLVRGSVRTVLEAMKPEVVMAYGAIRMIDGKDRYLYTLRPGSIAIRWAAVGPNFVPQQGSLLRLAAVREVGFLDEALGYAMDLDLFLKLRKVGKVVYVPEVVGCYRWHEDALTVSDPKFGVEARTVRFAQADTSWRRTLVKAERPVQVANRIAYKVALFRHERRLPADLDVEGYLCQS